MGTQVLAKRGRPAIGIDQREIRDRARCACHFGASQGFGREAMASIGGVQKLI